MLVDRNGWWMNLNTPFVPKSNELGVVLFNVARLSSYKLGINACKEINPIWLSVPKIATLIQGFDAKLANRTL